MLLFFAFLLPPHLLLDTPEIGLTGTTAPPLYDEGMVSPSKTWEGPGFYHAQFGQGASLFRVGQFPLRQYPVGGMNQEGQPAGHY